MGQRRGEIGASRQSTQEGNIRAHTNGCVDIGHLRGAREVRVDMDNRRAALLGRHHPAKPDRVAFGKVATLYQNAVTMLQILQEGIGGTAPEACAETRH